MGDAFKHVRQLMGRSCMHSTRGHHECWCLLACTPAQPAAPAQRSPLAHEVVQAVRRLARRQPCSQVSVLLGPRAPHLRGGAATSRHSASRQQAEQAEHTPGSLTCPVVGQLPGMCAAHLAVCHCYHASGSTACIQASLPSPAPARHQALQVQLPTHLLLVRVQLARLLQQRLMQQVGDVLHMVVRLVLALRVQHGQCNGEEGMPGHQQCCRLGGREHAAHLQVELRRLPIRLSEIARCSAITRPEQ